MILFIDNYDSFVFNLARYFRRFQQETVVRRNDVITPAEIRQLAPRAIVLSPGPCTPQQAGCSVEIVQTFWGKIPILGICLGHQAIATAFGGRVVRAAQPMHGRTSQVFHCCEGIFAGVPHPVTVCRYHSLVVERSSLPASLEVIAETADRTIMGLRHRDALTIGLQFHPESILTEAGYTFIANFLRLAGIEAPPPDPSTELAVQPVLRARLPSVPVTF